MPRVNPDLMIEELKQQIHACTDGSYESLDITAEPLIDATGQEYGWNLTYTMVIEVDAQACLGKRLHGEMDTYQLAQALLSSVAWNMVTAHSIPRRGTSA